MTLSSDARPIARVKAGATRTVNAEGSEFFRAFRDLQPFMWPGDRPDLKLRIALALLMLVLTKLVTIAVPYAFKWATDALTLVESGRAAPSDGTWLAVALGAPVAMVALYGLGRILMVVTAQMRDALTAAVVMHAVRRMALRVFDHIHRLSLRFHLKRRTGGLARVVERGRTAIETLTRTAMLTVAPTLFELALVLGVLWWQFDWRYVAAVLTMILVYTTFTYRASEWRLGIRRVMNEQDTDASSKAIDSLLNYETVKYFGNEEREAARFDRAMAGYEQSAVKTYTSLSWLNAGQAVIFSIGLAVCMAMAVLDVRAGNNTVGDFVLINAMMIQLYQPLNFMGWVYREIKQAVTDIEAMFRLLAEDLEIKDKPGAKPIVITEGRVRFEDVHFSYEPGREILKGVTFEVPAGKTVAIVGPSGAGKSTISRLLFRFYDAQRGRVTIDGQDVRDVAQKSLRDAVGMVPQDTVLFNDTIRYNIRYGRWDAANEDIERAAQAAQIDSFIRAMPKGYDTEVGERGLKLSGGEKQRVAIARTILKGPPILILDEATSALDSYTEKEIQDELEQVARGRTTLVIAHRLSTIINADEIIVLSAGEIVERGTHAELLIQDGLYAGMWARQREADEAREKLAATGEDTPSPDKGGVEDEEPEEDFDKPPPIAAAAGTLG
jgi:ATP-binding cassette subfamily B protein